MRASGGSTRRGIAFGVGHTVWRPHCGPQPPAFVVQLQPDLGSPPPRSQRCLPLGRNASPRPRPFSPAAALLRARCPGHHLDDDEKKDMMIMPFFSPVSSGRRHGLCGFRERDRREGMELRSTQVRGPRNLRATNFVAAPRLSSVRRHGLCGFRERDPSRGWNSGSTQVRCQETCVPRTSPLM